MSSLTTPAGDTERIKGCWDSIHVVEVQEKGRSAHYKLTSTVMLWLQTIKAGSGTMNLGGSLFRQVGGELGCYGRKWVRGVMGVAEGPSCLSPTSSLQVESDHAVNDASPHISNVGRMVEDMENRMRTSLNEIYFGKTKDVVNDLRWEEVGGVSVYGCGRGGREG